ncbi:MAG: hypothetical protein LUG93_05380, partial [Lachnospiraceae bacterium]|nr:hypothetical protein [Lachnospiraceae bacterium]
MTKKRITAWLLVAAMTFTQGFGNANLALAAESDTTEEVVSAISLDDSGDTDSTSEEESTAAATSDTESADSTEEAAEEGSTDSASAEASDSFAADSASSDADDTAETESATASADSSDTSAETESAAASADSSDVDDSAETESATESADSSDANDAAETESAASADASDTSGGTESATESSDSSDTSAGTELAAASADSSDTSDETDAAETEAAGSDTSDSAADDTEEASASDESVTVSAEEETETASEETEAESGTEAESETEGETEQIEVTGEDSDTPDDSDLSTALSAMADSDDLYETYLYRLFYGGVSALSNYGLNYFADDELNYDIYLTLRNAVSDIAAGNETSTQISIDLSDYGLSWTAEELGVSDSSTTDELGSLGTVQFQETLFYSTIAYCLIADCPYELYWFDKGTGGYTVSWSVSYSGTKDSDGNITYTAVTFKSITFKFSVISDYQDSSADDPQYTLDTSMVSTAEAAAANAQAIVSEYADLSDSDKLTAYKDAICDLVSYDEDAASDDYDLGYGDPWGLVYVFDGDDSTNVVCEGYSKAFQYLCDLGLSDAVCYTVSGTMTGGTGEGGHMWNIVTLDGVNYLVDVTNSDSGSTGQDGGLFLVTGDDATDISYDDAGYPVYTFTISDTEIVYTYGESTETLYGSSGILTLGYSGEEDTGYIVWFEDLRGGDYNFSENEDGSIYLTEDDKGSLYTFVYSDEELTVPLNTDNLSSYESFTVEWALYNDSNDHETIENGSDPYYAVSSDGCSVVLYGAALAETFDVDDTWLDLEAVVYDADGEEIARFDTGFSVTESVCSYDFPYGDWIALPGWNYWIDASFNCYVANADYPYGQDFGVTITDITVANADDETSEESICEENSDDHDSGYNIYANSLGHATATVTYTTWDGGEATDTFDIYVNGDVYTLDMDTTTRADWILPGESLDIEAAVWHGYADYNDENEEYECDEEYLEDVTFSWELANEDDAEILTIEVDEEDSSVLHVTAASEYDDCGVQILVTAYNADGEELTSGDYWIYPSHDYYVMTVNDTSYSIDEDLEVGGELAVAPAVTHFYVDDDGNAASEDVTAELYYHWEWDTNAVQITDADGSVLAQEEEDGSDAWGVPGFTLKKLENWYTELTLRAYRINDDGDYEEVYGYGVYLYEVDYSVWIDDAGDAGRFNEDGNTWAYVGESAFAIDLNVENLSDYDSSTYELIWQIGDWIENEDGDYDWTAYSSVDMDSCATLDHNDARILLDITAIEEAITGTSVDSDDFSTEGFQLRAFVVPAGEDTDSELASTNIWVDVYEPTYDYQMFDTWDLLPGWGIDIGSTINCYVEDPDYPFGENVSVELVDIEITGQYSFDQDEDGNNLEADYTVVSKDGSAQDGWWYLYGEDYGYVTLKVTYLSLDGETELTYGEDGDFCVYVVGDVYTLESDYTDGTTEMLLGETKTINLSIYHDYVNDDGDNDGETLENISVSVYWDEDEEGVAYATYDTDIFDIEVGELAEDGCTVPIYITAKQTGGCDIYVRGYDSDGNEVAGTSLWVNCTDDYYVLTPTWTGVTLDLGESIDLNDLSGLTDDGTTWALTHYYTDDDGNQSESIGIDGTSVRLQLDWYDESVWTVSDEAGDLGLPTLTRIASWESDVWVRVEILQTDDDGNAEYDE